MAADVEPIVIGANGRVFVGDPETVTPPSDSTSALGAGYHNVGVISEDGARFTDTRNVFDVRIWGSFYPARRGVESRDAMIAFVMRGWDGVSVPLAFGGGAITETSPGSGEFVYTPPAPELIDLRTMVVEWEDGNRHFRLYMERGLVTNNVETQFFRTGPSDLPIEFSATPNPGDDPYLLYTDDANFANLGTAS